MANRTELFMAYVQPHWRRLHLVARRYAATVHDARDLVQEAVLRAWQNFSPIDAGSYDRAWLFVILRNVAREWHRARQRRIRLIPLEDSAFTEIAASELTDSLPPLPILNDEQFREFLDARLAAAVDALEEGYREVLMLSVVGDLTYAEIAEVLDCPIGTVMSRMARARRTIRERLADYARAEGWLAERRP